MQLASSSEVNASSTVGVEVLATEESTGPNVNHVVGSKTYPQDGAEMEGSCEDTHCSFTTVGFPEEEGGFSLLLLFQQKQRQTLILSATLIEQLILNSRLWKEKANRVVSEGV